MSQTGAAPMRSAPHPPRGAVAGPDPGDEPFALLDFALGQALGADWGRGYLGEVLARYAAASGGRAALLLRLPPWREPAVLAAFPSSAADPALVTAVSSMLAGHPAGGAGGGCVEGPLALPHQLATAGSPDWAAIRPVRVLAAYASPDIGAAGQRPASAAARGQRPARQRPAGPGPARGSGSGRDAPRLKPSRLRTGPGDQRPRARGSSGPPPARCSRCWRPSRPGRTTTPRSRSGGRSAWPWSTRHRTRW